MQDFTRLTKLYSTFKDTIAQAASQQFLTHLLSVDVQSRSQASVRKLKQDWVDRILADVDKGFEKFREKMAERVFNWLASRNPYNAYQGDKITIFPEGTKFWFRGTRAVVVIVEQRPQVRSCRFDKDKWGRENFHLALPYVIFIPVFSLENEAANTWKLHKLYMGFRNQPLKSADDMLFQAPFPDMQNLDVCLGKNWIYPTGTVPEQVDATVAYFWDSKFMHEWTSNMATMADRDERFKYIAYWERASNENSLFPLSVQWEPNSTVRQHLAFLAVNFSGLLSSEVAQDIISDAIADSWDAVKQQCVSDVKALELIFQNCLTDSLQKITTAILDHAVKNMDDHLLSKLPQASANLNNQDFRQIEQRNLPTLRSGPDAAIQTITQGGIIK